MMLFDRRRPLHWIELALALTLSTVVIAWNLGAQQFNGDELNALHFMRDSLPDYLRSFHYNNTIKTQFWIMHQFFGNDFAWYRAPAAIAGILACACLFLPRAQFLPNVTLSRVLVVLLLVFNSAFFFFARWGMPNYAEAIAVSALLLGLILRGILGGKPTPAWTIPELLCIAILPWLYPTTIIMMGGISLFFGISALHLLRKPAQLKPLFRNVALAAVPLVLGLASATLYYFVRPSEDWARARAHHLDFTEWSTTSKGDWFDFLLHGLAGLYSELTTAIVPADSLAGQVFTSGYSLALLLVLLSVIAMPLLAWMDRRRGRSADVASSALRAYLFLVTVLVSSLLVAFAASLLDAFPFGKVRYMLFLLPLSAFIALVALSFVGWRITNAMTGTQGRLVAILAGLALMVFSSGGVIALADHLSALRERQGALTRLLASPDNRAVISWEPGFFFPRSLLHESVPYFRMARGRAVPDNLVQLLSTTSASNAPKRLVVFSRSHNLIARSGKMAPELSELITSAQYQLVERRDASPYSVFVFEARSSGLADTKTVVAEFLLPAGYIRTIRIQPTELREAQVAIRQLSLDAGSSGEREIELCGQSPVQRVRAQRQYQEADGACVFTFGDSGGPGWIAPAKLKRIEDTGMPRHLRIEADGALGHELKIYLYLEKQAGVQTTTLLRARTRTRSSSEAG